MYHRLKTSKEKIKIKPSSPILTFNHMKQRNIPLTIMVNP